MSHGWVEGFVSCICVFGGEVSPPEQRPEPHLPPPRCSLWMQLCVLDSATRRNWFTADKRSSHVLKCCWAMGANRAHPRCVCNFHIQAVKCVGILSQEPETSSWSHKAPDSSPQYQKCWALSRHEVLSGLFFCPRWSFLDLLPWSVLWFRTQWLVWCTLTVAICCMVSFFYHCHHLSN